MTGAFTLLNGVGSAPMPARPTPLTCEECGREQPDGERGWRSLLTVHAEGDPEGAVHYCRDCAEREFPRDERRLP